MTERGEIETMLRRLEELRRAARTDDLRGAYRAAIERLDAVAYRLAQLRAPEPPVPTPAPPAPKAAAAAPPGTAARHQPRGSWWPASRHGAEP